MLKKEKGITLVALVITIIILVILAGISISALTDQGIFAQANKAKKEAQRAQVTEWLNLKLMEEQMQKPFGTSEEIVEATRAASYGNKELAQMGKKVVVDENTSTIEDGEEVDVYFYVQVDEDVYKVEMSGAKFIGEEGKFPPVITVESLTNTTNSITIKIKVSRNEGGELIIYKKKENEATYTVEKEATGDEVTGLEYTFEGLEQNKNYSIKIVATAKNGQIKEHIENVSLGSVPTGESAITFTPVTWSDGKASTTISSTETGYTLQYQINSISENGWKIGTSVTELVHGDNVYARLWDGTNGGKETAANNILDVIDPSASIDLSATNVGTTGSITATVTHTDNESGVDISNCKWVYNTTSTPIGTNESNYKGGTFSSNPQPIILSATTAGTYYLHILTTDVAGRKVETISNAVTVTLPKLASKVQPGDYVTYTPDAATTTGILSELLTYSGSTANKTSTLTQETGLKWRVLDVTNDGKVRLISEVPTTSTVTLSSYNGYNNAVYLLDKTCKTLYSKAGYSENVQNLKIEDIQNKMSIDYRKINLNYGQPFSPTTYKKYPSILAQEAGQTVNGTTGTLGLSQQTTPINQTAVNTATSWTVKYTYWGKKMAKSDFTNPIYYNLFINNGSNYSTYWMSSRCVGAGVYNVFYVRYVSSGGVLADYLYSSNDAACSYGYALRPVVTLNSSVQVKSGEGSQTSPYEI